MKMCIILYDLCTYLVMFHQIKHFYFSMAQLNIIITANMCLPFFVQRFDF